MITDIPKNTMKIHVGSRKFYVPEEILHLESNLNYTQIFLANGQRILSSTTLKTIERRLSPFKNFIRINRQNIVNQDFIPLGDQLTFTLPDNRTVKFSRRKAKAYLTKI